MKIIINDSERLSILKNIHVGPYSREATHDTLDELLKEIDCEHLINNSNYNVSTKQLQALLNLIDILNKKLQSKGGN